MKKIKFLHSVFILFISLMIFSCKETIVYEDQREYFKEEQGILYYKGSPYNGKLIKFLNGEKNISTLNEGKVDGEFEHYYKNGQLKEGGFFKNGKKEGNWKTYYENGIVSSTGPYLNGLEEGDWVYYFEDGKVKLKGSYLLGSKDKVWENYYETGILFDRITYIVTNKGIRGNSWKNGFYEEFYPNGKIRTKGNYEIDRQIGEWIRYDEEGQQTKKIFN